MRSEPGVQPPGDAGAEALAAFVSDLERARLRSLVAPDLEVAQMLHASDYQLVTPSGAIVTRDDYLRDIASGALEYRVFEPASEIAVLLLDGGAAVRYQARIEVAFPGGFDRVTAWHTDLYRVSDGRWRAVWSQATHIRS